MSDADGRLWPPTFLHNPWTGEVLSPALSPLPPTGGRFGSINGLPFVDTIASTIDTSSKQAVPLERGAFNFAQGGTPGFLYAADLHAGIVFRQSRLESGWIDHGSYPHSDLPLWAGGMVGNSEGVFYSGQVDLVRLNEDPEDDGAEKYALGPMASSPAALPLGIAAPFHDKDGLGIGWLPLGGRIARVPVRVVSGKPDARPLAAPAITHTGIVFWIGATGFISFQLGRSGPAATWRAWPDQFAALPFLRPFRTANGQLWAFGTLDDAEAKGRAAVCLVSNTNGAPDVRVLDGPHVSAGDHSYRGLSRHPRPWAEPDDRVQPGLDMHDRWALPLVKLPNGDTVVALVSDITDMRAMVFREQAQPRGRLATLFLHRPNAGIVALGHSFDFTTTDDIDLFVSGERLHIYHRDTNECVSWLLV